MLLQNKNNKLSQKTANTACYSTKITKSTVLCGISQKPCLYRQLMYSLIFCCSKVGLYRTIITKMPSNHPFLSKPIPKPQFFFAKYKPKPNQVFDETFIAPAVPHRRVYYYLPSSVIVRKWKQSRQLFILS